MCRFDVEGMIARIFLEDKVHVPREGIAVSGITMFESLIEVKWSRYTIVSRNFFFGVIVKASARQ